MNNDRQDQQVAWLVPPRAELLQASGVFPGLTQAAEVVSHSGPCLQVSGPEGPPAHGVPHSCRGEFAVLGVRILLTWSCSYSRDVGHSGEVHDGAARKGGDAPSPSGRKGWSSLGWSRAVFAGRESSGAGSYAVSHWHR